MMHSIVILNWKNANDTIDCIKSIVKSINIEECQLVICDNNSNDGSDNKILLELKNYCTSTSEWLFETDLGILNRINNSNNEIININSFKSTLIRIDKNIGFAGGNNVGLKWVLDNTNSEVVVILNNDTIINTNTVCEGITYLSENPMIGIAGCVVRYFHNPNQVQAFGGASFSPLFGRAKHLCSGLRYDQLPPVAQVLSDISYPLGAAMFVSRAFLVDVGLMYEKYFLYFEEIDWACSARAKGYDVGIADRAIVFHKEGGTIGSSHDKSKRSHVSERYLNRGRLMFTRRWHPFYVPSVLGYNLFIAFRAFIKGDFSRARVIASATWQGLTDDL